MLALEEYLHTTAEALTAPDKPVMNFKKKQFSNLLAMMLIRQRYLAVALEGDLHTTVTLTAPVVAAHLQKTIL